jgi:REP element-mobilizing transposase RayT
MSLPERKRPVHWLPVERHNRSIIVFLTVCTKDRRPLLANQQMHAALRDAWVAAGNWRVGRYVVLPDHIHLFLRARRLATACTQAVGYFLEAAGRPENRTRWNLAGGILGYSAAAP